jgi:Planctomycete cytochrome C
MKRHLLPALLCLPASLACAVDFKTQVTPVLKQYCYKCHSEAEKKEKGKLALDNLTKFAAKMADNKAMIKPGDAAGSSFYTCLVLPADEDDHMPPKKEAQMKPAEIELIKAWITEGAAFDGAGKAPAPAADAAAGGMKTWTNTAGQSIQASFLRLEGDNVVIQRADGVCFSVPLASLSPESQALAKGGM